MTIVTETWLQNTSEDTIWVEGSQLNKNVFKYTCVINKRGKVGA